MKIEIQTEILKTGLKDVSAAIGNKSAIPILECVVLTPKGENLTLEASDGDVWITRTIQMITPAEEDTFPISIKAKEFTSAISALPEQPLIMEAEEGIVKVIYSNGSFSMPYNDAEDFPQPKKGDEEKLAIIREKASSLEYAINSALTCVGKDSLRIVLNGCCIDIQDDGVRVVASDGHKLSKVLLPQSHATGGGKAICLPTKATMLLRNMISKNTSEETVQIEIDSSLLYASYTDGTITARLTDGNYPKYDGIIPEECTCTCEVEKEAAMMAIRRVSQFADQNSQMIRMVLCADSSMLRIEGVDKDFSRSAKEEMACVYNGQEDMTIGIKSTALLDVLSAISTDRVVFNIISPDKAIVIKPVIDTDFTLTQAMLVMPMMIV